MLKIGTVLVHALAYKCSIYGLHGVQTSLNVVHIVCNAYVHTRSHSIL